MSDVLIIKNNYFVANCDQHNGFEQPIGLLLWYSKIAVAG